MNADYLEANKQLTKDFIAFDSVDIVLTPRVKESDGQGGFRFTAGTPREAQTVALIEPGNSGFQQPVATVDGTQYTIDYMLLGEFDAVMARDDVFVWDGYEFKLLEIMPFNGYEKRAVVIRHGW